jgi:glutamate-ammonia-ligase adenylyltransferase
MAGEPRSRLVLAGILTDLLGHIAGTADPDQALTHWERYVAAAGNRAHLFQYLRDSPRMLHVLCSIFGNSPALAETLIRDPLLLYWLAEEDVLGKAPSAEALRRAVASAAANVETLELKLEALRRIRRREMLRIGVRDLLRAATVEQTTVALSDLADALIQVAYETVDRGLRARHGAPMHRDRRGASVPTGFAVIAMGKLGGGELNFSSDVDLLYVYGSSDGKTRPPKGGKAIGNDEYFEYVARALTGALSERTAEGYVYRVDLRLRPEGRMGPLARSLAAFEAYYAARGEMWERQALLKARPVAGDPEVGRAFLRLTDRFVFRADATPAAVLDEVRRVKARIDDTMEGRGHASRNVKLGTGGIREIEFLVQAIQLVAGGARPEIRDRNTLGALTRLVREHILSRQDGESLAQAYRLLRDVEHKLQLVHDLQTHALPDSDEEMARCAIRLGYPGRTPAAVRARFLSELKRQTSYVNRIFRDLIDRSRPARFGGAFRGAG